ncbi:hypothetical protein ScPMuIL_014832 [Solemya velum]
MADTEEENGASKATDTELNTNQSSSKESGETQAEPTNGVPEDMMDLAKEEIQKSLSKIMAAGNLSLSSETGANEQLDSQSPHYVEPIPDPYEKSIQYLEKHNIMQLFQTLTTDIVFKKPNNPLDYMIGEIEDLKKQRDSPE